MTKAKPGITLTFVRETGVHHIGGVIHRVCAFKDEHDHWVSLTIDEAAANALEPDTEYHLVKS